MSEDLTVMDALWQTQQISMAGQIAFIQLPTGVSELVTTFTFGQGVTASEIVIRGQQQQQGRRLSLATGTSLRLPPGQSKLLKIRNGAPLITIEHMTFLNPIVVDGGRLRLVGCTFANISSEHGRALEVNGGEVEVLDGHFVGNEGGGIEVKGDGRLVLADSLLERNLAARGAAMLVDGGESRVQNCRFESNAASESGGGLQIDGGVCELSDQSVLLGNTAPQGNTILSTRRDALTYRLPCSMGRWILAAIGNTSALEGAIDADFPYACSAGLLGSSFELLEQSTPQCSGPCPAGFACGAASSVAQPCPNGTYCPRGTPSPIPCPAGTVGRQPMLTLRDECEPCPHGVSCPAGSAVELPCPPGRHAPNPESSECTPCPGGTRQPLEGQPDCILCESGLVCPRGSATGTPCDEGTSSAARGLSAREECTDCVEGFFGSPPDCRPCLEHAECPAGTNISTLRLADGYWRLSSLSDVISPCDIGTGAPLGTQQRDNATACRGGSDAGAAGEGYCLEGHEGPRCQVCTQNASLPTRYFDERVARCAGCPSLGVAFAVATSVLLALALLLVGLHILMKCPPRRFLRLSAFCRRAWLFLLDLGAWAMQIARTRACTHAPHSTRRVGVHRPFGEDEADDRLLSDRTRDAADLQPDDATGVRVDHAQRLRLD